MGHTYNGGIPQVGSTPAYREQFDKWFQRKPKRRTRPVKRQPEKGPRRPSGRG